MLPLLIDENLNQRILRGLRRVLPRLDYAVTQNIGLRGADDPSVLARASEARRVLVTHDVRTIPRHAYDRIKTGHAMSGVIVVPDSMPIGQAIEDLLLIAECSESGEWEGQVRYLPLR